MTEEKKYNLTVHKSSDTNKGERYHIKVHDSHGNDVTPEPDGQSPLAKARGMSKSEYDNFVRNGGAQTVCNYCADRQEVKSELHALEQRDDLDPATKNSERQRILQEAAVIDDGFKSQMDSVMGEDWTNGQIEDHLSGDNAIEPLPLKGSKVPKAEQIDMESDADGDGIPDHRDKDSSTTPEESEQQKKQESFAGYHGKLTKADRDAIDSGSLPPIVQDESSWIPEYLPAAGDDNDASIQSKKTNTWIVFGRDRTGLATREKISKTAESQFSGYGNHMAAGAIDIVAGRGAPFPTGELTTGPLFQTTTIKMSTPIGPKGETPHPGYAMDAARVYISQKTDADRNFGIVDYKYEDVFDPKRTRIGIDQKTSNPQVEGKVMPRSAVVAKADEIRIISRHDIKLVTGGARHGSNTTIDGTYNSQGGRIQTTEGIQLLAGNGYDSFGKPNLPEPFVLGKRHVKAQNQMLDLLHDLAAIIEALLMTQMEFNAFVMTHFHLSPLFGFPTTFSPILPIIGIKTMIDHIVRAYLGIIFFRMNLTTYRVNFLEASSKEYVLSRYNTTN